MRRHDLLRRLHERFAPRTYLEVGTNEGRSLSLSRTRSIGVDPAFEVSHELECELQLVRQESDLFFARQAPVAYFGDRPTDLAFIDGMHLAEYALRDFINTERYTHPASVIVFDDMLPRSTAEASRARVGQGAWAGDVYKVTDALRKLRPDLVVLEVDTKPTGTVVVFNPDAGSQVLAAAYDDLVEAYVTPDPQSVPSRVLQRTAATDPEALLEAPIWDGLRRLRGTESGSARTQVATLLAGAGLATPR